MCICFEVPVVEGAGTSCIRLAYDYASKSNLVHSLLWRWRWIRYLGESHVHPHAIWRLGGPCGSGQALLQAIAVPGT